MPPNTFGWRQAVRPVPPGTSDFHRSDDNIAGSDRDQAIVHLDKNTSRLRLAGQLVASIGILFIFGAAIYWPIDPLSPNLIDNKIYVPLTLAFELKSLGFGPSTEGIFDGPSVAIVTLFLALLIPLCWVSIFRRDWIVVATISAIMILPWEYVGFPAPFRVVQLTCLAVLVPLRLMRFNNWAKAGVIVVALIGGIQILHFVTSITRQIVPDFSDKYARYSVLTVNRLARDQRKMQRLSAFLSPTKNPHDTPVKAGARAFALAQEQYKQSDAEGVHAAIRRLDRFDQPMNTFERQRIAVMRDYAAIKGVMGPTEQSRASRSYQYRSIFAWFVLILGSLAALLGPFSRILHTKIRSRAERIKTVQKQLKAAVKANPRVDRHTDMGSLPETPAATHGLQSMAALDGKGAILILQDRFRRYAVVAGSLLGLGMLGWGANLMFGLPPADQNTAFDTVALLSDVARHGTAAGYFPKEPKGLQMTFSLMYVLSPFVFIAAIILFFFRKSKTPALAMLLFAVIFNQAGPYLVTPKPIYELPATTLTATHRTVLATRARQTERSPASLREKKNRNATNRVTIDFVAGDHAAFTLAQAAYIEDDPARAARFLDLIRHYDRFRPPYAKRRLIIMREWATAKGETISQDAWTTFTSIPPATARLMAFVAQIVAVGALVCGLLLFALAGLVDRRIRTLRNLVTKRSQTDMPARMERIVAA